MKEIAVHTRTCAYAQVAHPVLFTLNSTLHIKAENEGKAIKILDNGKCRGKEKRF